VIQYGFEFIQPFGTASGLIITFIVNKMKELEKVKPTLSEKVKKYECFQNFPPEKKQLVIQFLVKSL
jgi:hypothetical protein